MKVMTTMKRVLWGLAVVAGLTMTAQAIGITTNFITAADSIQTNVNAVAPGSTIVLAAGVYTNDATVVIGKTLNLVNADNMDVDPNTGARSNEAVVAANVVIQDATNVVIMGVAANQITATNVVGAQLINNIVSNNVITDAFAICLDSAQESVVSQCRLIQGGTLTDTASVINYLPTGYGIIMGGNLTGTTITRNHILAPSATSGSYLDAIAIAIVSNSVMTDTTAARTTIGSSTSSNQNTLQGYLIGISSEASTPFELRESMSRFDTVGTPVLFAPVAVTATLAVSGTTAMEESFGHFASADNTSWKGYFKTIGCGVRFAEESTTVQIYQGGAITDTFDENIAINKSLYLRRQANSPYVPVLKGSNAALGVAITISGSDTIVQVKGLTITNAAVGVKVDTGSTAMVNLHENNILTVSGVENATVTRTTYAWNNWWGSTADPAAKMQGSVSYSPWMLLAEPSAPEAALTSEIGDYTKLTNITVAVKFTEIVTNFTVDCITATHGRAENLASIDGSSYTFTLVPTNASLVDVTFGVSAALGAGKVQDVDSVWNVGVVTYTTTFDSIAPVPTLATTANPRTSVSPIPYTLLFSKVVTGLTAADISVVNGTAGSLNGSGNSYTFSVTPSANGTVSVILPSGVCQDAAGNLNAASSQIDVVFDDVAPTTTIASSVTPRTNTNVIPVAIVFSESMTNFDVSDIVVANGTITVFVMVGRAQYTFNLIVTAQGTVSVTVPANVAQDDAGNGNLVGTGSWVYDATSPTVIITSTTTSPTRTAPIYVSVTFDKTVVGFTVADVATTLGTVQNFSGSGAFYTFTVMPTAFGTVKVEIPAGVCVDEAGNANTVATPYLWAFLNTESSDPVNPNSPGDVDGDGRVDLVVYNETLGSWSMLLSSLGYSMPTTATYGGLGYGPVVGDYDGDGKTDLAVFNPSTGLWFVRMSSTGVDVSIVFGAGCWPVIGDFDNDGKVDPGVYNFANGGWYVMQSASGYAVATAVLGGSTYMPVAADFDGDGKTDPAVYTELYGQWTVMMSGSGYQPVSAVFGGIGYTPLVGDYDGDQKADPTVYNATYGRIATMLSASAYAPIVAVCGGPGYVAISADFDLDGKADPVVYNETTGLWVALLSGSSYAPMAVTFGGPGYQPVGAW